MINKISKHSMQKEERGSEMKERGTQKRLVSVVKKCIM